MNEREARAAADPTFATTIIIIISIGAFQVESEQIESYLERAQLYTVFPKVPGLLSIIIGSRSLRYPAESPGPCLASNEDFQRTSGSVEKTSFPLIAAFTAEQASQLL